MQRSAVILTDIEGTTTPVGFVHDVLFPYSRERLASWVQQHAREPHVAPLVDAVARARDRPETPLARVLERWIDEDSKNPVLKELQGLLWCEGYAAGHFLGQLYPDVPSSLSRLRTAGVALAVYSSGSVLAQRCLFRYSNAGDLSGWMSHFFDTAVGPKRESRSYARIASALSLPAERVTFVSDTEAELDAALEAGMDRIQMLRAGTVPSARHLERRALERLVAGELRHPARAASRGDEYAFNESRPFRLARGAAIRVSPLDRRCARNTTMELLATTAVWSGGQLTIYECTQGATLVKTVVAGSLQLDPAVVHVKSGFVGGGFGQKGAPQRQTAIVAKAAMLTGHPVKLVAPRGQVFHQAIYRPRSRHRVRLGADANGRITAAVHEATQENTPLRAFPVTEYHVGVSCQRGASVAPGPDASASSIWDYVTLAKP